MSIPNKKNTSIDQTSIITGNVTPSKVYEPQWINNQTRLNQTNVELMRSNMIKYVNSISRDLYKELVQNHNDLIKNSAGWVIFNVDGDAVGEIFNSDSNNNNTVNDKKKYQAAFGKFTSVNGEAQFVCGKYNAEEEDALFIVGCGSNENDRRNAIVVKADGSVSILNNVLFANPVEFDSRVLLKGPVRFEGTAEFLSQVIVDTAPSDARGVVRKAELDALRDEISGALHYIGVTPCLKIEDDKSVTVIDEDFKIYLNNGNFKTGIKLHDGDVVLIGEYNDDDIFITTGDECIYSNGSWTYYGAYANYVPMKEYQKNRNQDNTARETADKAIIEKIWEEGLLPSEDDDTISERIDAVQQYITKLAGVGYSDIPSDYLNSNTTLRSEIDKLKKDIDDINANIDLNGIHIDGGGVPEDAANWEGNFNENV